MKTIYLIMVGALLVSSTYGQVGIGTTSPSKASMLEVSGTTNGLAPYKGFMPARVPTRSNRDLINATSTDIGLLVFVTGTGTLEIWNGINWETIYTLGTLVNTVAIQDFDTNLTWNYVMTPAPYNVIDDIWMVGSNLGSGDTSAIDNVNGNFLACRDLNNVVGGGNFFHDIAFANVNVSGLTNSRLAFDYDVFEFDAGDDVQYEVFHDDVGQGIVTLINGVGNLNAQGTVTITIPGTVTNVRITLGIRQNGDGDYAGFDNFRVYGQ